MGTLLTGDQAMVAFRKLGELQRQLGQDGGYPFNPEKLFGALQALTEGRFEAIATSYPSQVHCPELIPDGWSIAIVDGVAQDVAPSDFDISKLKPRTFLKGEPAISGPDMRLRAIEFGGNKGLSDGKQMLVDGGKLIPVEFQGFYIPLPGTVLRDSDGSLRVPCLSFGGGQWVLGFGWLDVGWSDDDRLACSESPGT